MCFDALTAKPWGKEVERHIRVEIIASDQKVIRIEKRRHRGEWEIFLHYAYQQNIEIERANRKLPNRQYSRTHRLWYIPYRKVTYAHLKNYPLQL